MKYFVTAALAVALMGAAATAQAENPRDRDQHRTEARPARAEAPRTERTAPRVERTAPRRVERAAPTVDRRAPSRVERTAPRLERTAPRVERTAPRVEHTAARVDHRTATRNDRGRPAVGHAGAGRPGFGYQSHGLRPSDRGRAVYSVSVYRQEFVATRRYRYVGGGYPGGWYAHSWYYGNVLPIGWYGPEFYLNFGLYGLLGPPIGCEWVREGPDAVLVDIWSGQVLSVERGVFY